MPATQKLARFNVVRSGEDYDLHIEDEAGHVLEIGATRDQIDAIADALDDLLSEDESADEVEDDEAEGGLDGEKV